ncbi:MAG: stage II sporulation protein P [Dorea sp.]|nr:stage II sporulation protein P [Dorea sp.]
MGIHMNIGISDEMEMYLGSVFLQQAEKTYLSGFSYASEGGGPLPKQWVTECAALFLPLGTYVSESAPLDMEVEDSATYEMILEQQANDENTVDENGDLIEKETAKTETEQMPAETPKKVDTSKDKLKDFEYLVSNFYTVDGTTSVSAKDLDAEKLLAKSMKLDKKKKGPKVLIYHTHSQEDFKDSKKGDPNTTIMGMGAYLSKILNETYKIETIHHEGVYDLIDGEMDRSKAYQLAEKQVAKILKEYPSIEVVIDLHRDGVGSSTHLVTDIDGKQTAQIMFFNGMSRTKANGDIAYLYNPYIEDNLAFSLQMQIAASKLYPGFTRHIYLKSYRYNLHLKPKSLLIEAGAQTNTVEEMRNAMEALAKVLDECVDP